MYHIAPRYEGSTPKGSRLKVLSVFNTKEDFAMKFYHNATFPAIPKSTVAVTTPRALNTLLIVGIVML